MPGPGRSAMLDCAACNQEGAQVQKARRNSIARDLRAVSNSLSSMARAIRRLAPLLAAAAGEARAVGPARGRKRKLSPERRAALALQGQYIGHMRNLPARHRAQVKARRAAKGLRPAIALAKRLGRR